MTTVNIYLTFNGNCRPAFEFYKSVFGGEYPYIGTYAEMPPTEGMPPVPEKLKDQIMHISLPISTETILMGSDAGGGWAPEVVVGNNFSVSVLTDKMEEADRIFNALSAGGKVTMPLQKQFWGAYYGQLTDKFNINWMVSFELKEGK